jgi:transcriptional regulator with XRE-family HTH domain
MGNRGHGLNVFGWNVRRWREEKGLTQESLAERANLDPTYISGIERGIRNPSVLSVIRIAKALGVTASKLLEKVDDLTTGAPHESADSAPSEILIQNKSPGGRVVRKIF